jgi:hypothetical protein
MSSNEDYLSDLESFLDSGLISTLATSTNLTLSPIGGQSNPISNDIGVRDHLHDTEKRKLEEGSSSNVMTKNQRTDNHHMILEGLDHGPFKNEEIKPEERDLKDEQPQQNYGGQRGLLVEALMDKGPNQTGFLGVTSPSSAVSRSSLDTTALKQQLDAIKNDATLKNDQKSAKIAEIFNQHPHLQRMLMATKLNNDNKMLRKL